MEPWGVEPQSELDCYPEGQWAELDLNQRRQSHLIYSQAPLTTRTPTQMPPAFRIISSGAKWQVGMAGIEPAT